MSAEISQWLYLHSALGNGYCSSVPDAPAWVVSAGVPSVLTARMRHAESAFHAWHEEQIASDRKKLEDIEHQIESLKRGPGRQARDTSEQLGQLSAQRSELKQRLSRPVFVNYRDWSADRATLLELLSKSKFRAMSFCDEYGVRAANYVLNKFQAAPAIVRDMALVSLMGNSSNDSILIRSSATGGSNILSLTSADKPRFGMMTLATPRMIKVIAKRFREAYAQPARGMMLIFDQVNPRTDLGIEAEHIERVLRNVYATEDPDKRIVVNCANDAGWQRLFDAQLPDLFGGEPSQAAIDAYAEGILSTRTIIAAAARAVITRRIFSEADQTGPDGDEERTVELTGDDLDQAWLWARHMLRECCGLKHLKVRAGNAAVARESKVDADRKRQEKLLEETPERIRQAIKESAHGYVTRTHITRKLHINHALLDQILQEHADVFEERRDFDNPERANMKVGSAVFLRPAEEDATSVPVGGEKTKTGIPSFDQNMLHRLFTTWQQTAYAAMLNGHRPVVSIADIPAALVDCFHQVQKLYWQTTTLIPSGDQPPILSEEDTLPPRPLEMWFRHAPSGKDMVDWERCYTEWNLAARWHEKDQPDEPPVPPASHLPISDP